jgi:pyruvate-ferredoxin/flavodoxin oxidoreductase
VRPDLRRTAGPSVTIDGNEAAAYVAFKTNEVIAIYPITPSSPMAELADAWAEAGEKNLWGGRPLIQEMQSEGGAAGAVHGSLQAGAQTTTFTASQGLLLMIPDMYKIAGELTSAVFHITARTIATHALSIFGDHSDVMAARSTGWAQLYANSVQEVMDFALIAQASTLRARIPFLHVFDGFRTSHEVSKIEKLPETVIRAMIDEELVRAHRARGLTPENPVIRGTAQNPDVFFQSREACNLYYQATPAIVGETMDAFERLTGRAYRLFDYVGAPDAEHVIVIMGSGAETAHETVEWLSARGRKVGLVKVRLFRPFSARHLLDALPETVKMVAVLDRTKEPGAAGEPLFLDVVAALFEEGRAIRAIGGRYGLSSKEFTPAMVKAVFDEMAGPAPRPRFTVGINDDVTHLSLDWDPSFSIEAPEVVRAVFWGLGSDGTVGANKNSIKIIGEETSNYAQGYFVYDSKKSGSVTVSHLRFGPTPIHSPYLISRASFVAVHQFNFLERFPVLATALEGATVLINAPFPPEEVWARLPPAVQHEIARKKLRLFALDGYGVAKETGMDNRMNTIMQTGFFALCGVLPRDEAIRCIKHAIEKTYGKRGEAVVRRNFAAVDAALDRLHEIAVPEHVAPVDGRALSETGDFWAHLVREMIAGRGDDLPVSLLPVDGTFPSGTAALEKRDIALEVPVWDPDVCIQCGKCVLVCPHSVIRAKVVEQAPEGLPARAARWKELPDHAYVLGVSVDDCTGCTLCVEICPARNKSAAGRKAINMAPKAEAENRWDAFLELPDPPRDGAMKYNSVKNIQLLPPLFEFSGACSGCGETPYVKLVSQLFGDRAVIANATGCSSIYGGNLPTTPWTRNRQGRGPAWANSLFEDNAEFGLGMRLALTQQERYVRQLLERMAERIGVDLVGAVLEAPQEDDSDFLAQRARIEGVRSRLSDLADAEAQDLKAMLDVLVRRSVWIIGGDGWAYDIGYGGLDHVLASGADVNILVLDTEVYSNTGGQMSKATSRGAVAKFAAGGRPSPKKDLGRMAMSYGNVYVAQIAMGGSDTQAVKAVLGAESYRGTSLILAYSHCIAHGIDMSRGMDHQRMAVESGHWPLYRYDPRLGQEGKNPFQLDSKAPSLPLRDYMYSETRYRMLTQSDPQAAERLLELAQGDVAARWQTYERMARGE